MTQLAYWPAPVALLASGAAWAGTTIERQPLGAFTVEREHYLNDGTPILHAANEWKKDRLVWTSSDGLMRFIFEDDGRTLNAGVHFAEPTGSACMSQGFPVAYPVERGPSTRWIRTLMQRYVRLLGNCGPSLPADRRKAYASEFASVATQYGQAFAILKDAAAEDFGGWKRRCLEWKRSEIQMSSGLPLMDCVRWSATAN